MPYISYTDGPAEKHYCIPEEGRMVIFGREDHTDFQILRDSQISREHFGIEKDDQERFTVIDLGSANGTFLNGRRLESNAIRFLKQGDVIRAGSQEFTFREKLPPPPPVAPPSGRGVGVKDVLKELERGKGYHTLMQEIVGARGKKAGAQKPGGEG